MNECVLDSDEIILTRREGGGQNNRKETKSPFFLARYSKLNGLGLNPDLHGEKSKRNRETPRVMEFYVL